MEVGKCFMMNAPPFSPSELLAATWFATAFCFILFPRYMYLVTSVFSMYFLYDYLKNIYSNTDGGIVYDLPTFSIMMICSGALIWCSIKAFQRAMA